MIFLKLILITTLLFYLQLPAFQNDDLEKAKQLFDNKEFEDAKTLLQKIITNNNKNHEAYFVLGKTYMKLKDPEEATEYFEEAVSLQENNADYHFWLGQAISMDAINSNIISQAMMASDILEQFEKTIELDPTHIPGRLGVIGFYTNAPSIMGGDMDKAKLNAKKLIELDEKRGRTALTQIYFKQDLVDSAEIQIELLEEKFGNDKSFGNFYNGLGYYYLRKNKTDKAIEVFKKQVKINPESANSYDSLGDGYRAAKKYDEAIVQYKKALEIDPNFSSSIKNLKELKRKGKNSIK